MSDELTTDCEMPWPSDGDILFKEGGEWQSTIPIGSRTWETMATGFQDLARLGVDNLVAQNAAKALIPEFLFYPIAYNYRQAVELRLKDVIEIGNRLFGESEKTWGHQLVPLWTSARRFAEQLYPSSPTEPLDNFDRILKELSDADPTSEAFRYHLNNKGGPSFSVNVTSIEIRNFAARMEGLGNFLYCLAAAMLDAESNQSEMSSYYY